MSRQSNAPALTVADDRTIVTLIHSASRRVIFMAPGVSKPVGRALARQWRLLGAERVNVIVDVDAEICRLGYGEIEALKELEEEAGRLGAMVLSQPGLRIGLVIADDQTLIYSPTPLLIEAAPEKSRDKVKPNAVHIGLPPADLERDLGGGPEGLAERAIGLDKADRASINESSEDLKRNPPQQFDISRKVRVFNTQFEFVELSITNAAIERRVLTLPNDLLGIDRGNPLNGAFRAKLQLIDPDSSVSGRRLNDLKTRIIREYCTHIPGYGLVVLRGDKGDLVEAVLDLRKAAAGFERHVRERLREELDQRVESLVETLLPLFLTNPPEALYERLSHQDPRELLKETVQKAIDRMKSSVRPISVHLVFKAVTYELLNDPQFIAGMRERLPALKVLHEEFYVAAGKPSSADDHDHGVAA